MNWTVVGWPAVTRRTTQIQAVLDGMDTIWPLLTAWPLSVTVAFWNVPNWIWCNRLLAAVLSGVGATWT